MPSRLAMLAVATAIAVGLPVVSCSRRKPPAACVDPAGAACQGCRDGAQAKFCDAKYVAPQASDSSSVNGQKGCCGFNDPKLRASCEAVLECVRRTGCAAGNDPSRCLCGDVDPMTCARSGKPHTGPCAAVYAAALVGDPSARVIPIFGDAKSPIGVANNTFTCEVDAACPCGKKP